MSEALSPMGDPLVAPAYAYLLLSTALLLVWLAAYAMRSDRRREILWVSLGTMPLGLTEPVFVPRYWNPLTLFDLARHTGFDLESLVFSFAIGGIVFAAYDVLVGTGPLESIASERHNPRHRYHLFAVLSAPGILVVLLALTSFNPIYTAALALVGGFVATLFCRPDLGGRMLVSGGLFLVLYGAIFGVFNVAFPGYVAEVWNLRALTGIRVVGIPLEELMFAFTFGLYWSSVYEHIGWRRTHSIVHSLV